MSYDPYTPRAGGTGPFSAEQPADDAGTAAGQTVAAGRLRAFVERIERLHEDAAAISEDLKEVYGELKGEGFDAKAVRAIVKMRKEDPAVRAEFEAIVDLYKTALGIA